MSRFTDTEVIAINRLFAAEAAEEEDHDLLYTDVGAPVGSFLWLQTYHDGLHDLTYLDTDLAAITAWHKAHLEMPDDYMARTHAGRAAHCAGMAMIIRQGLEHPEALQSVQWTHNDSFSAWGVHTPSGATMRMAQGLTASDADRFERQAVEFAQASADFGGAPRLFEEFRLLAARALREKHPAA